MGNFRKLFSWFMVCTLALSTAMACSIFSPRAEATPTAVSVLADTGTPTPKPTSTTAPTVTLTPSPLPSATATLLPSPTPTPDGYYLNTAAGYSVMLPNEFSVEETDDGSPFFIDMINFVFMFVDSYSESDGMSAQEAAEWVTEGFDYNTIEFSDPYEIEAANQVTLEAVDVDMETTEGGMSLIVMSYMGEGQQYVVTILGSSDDLSRAKNRIERTIASMVFFPPTLFTVDPNETLTYLGQEPDEILLDPALTTGGAGGFTGILYAGLVRLSPTMQIEPDLAESWTISADGTIYTFTLLPGLQFADGKPLTAEDIQKSWERAADPDTESTVAGTYLGDILGFKEKLEGNADTIEGLQVLDERTLQVTLDGPKPFFLAKLTYPVSFVVDTAQTGNEDWVWEPNESGPYVLKDHIIQEGLLFERNDRYHNPPAIRYLVFNLNPGGSTISLYESDRLDIAYLDAETAQRVRDESDPLHAEWQSVPSMCTSMVQLNNNIPPFNDIKVRQAFLQAIDPSLYNENLYQGGNLVARTILPPAMPGFSGDLAPLPYDPEAARALLEDSLLGGELPTIVLNASGYADSHRSDVDVLVGMWESNLGVEIEVVYLDPYEFSSAAHEQHGHIVIYGWCADYPDPENFLDILYHSDSEMNVSGYSNPDVDAILEQARIALDPAERIRLYQEAEALLIEDAAVIPLTHSVRNVLVKPRVQGFILSPIDSTYGHGMWLQEP